MGCPCLRHIALRRWNTMLHRIKEAHVGKRRGPANWDDVRFDA
jgi:hypothetical protein